MVEEEYVKQIKEYLALHRDNEVSFNDIVKTTGLERKIVLEVLVDLSSKNMLMYKFNPENREVNYYLSEYGQDVARGFERALKKNI